VIVSHRHRFIFLKTRKTAGTSIEIALSKVCGPDDIITKISPEDEQLRREWGGRGPQNYEATSDRRRAYNHMPARAVRRLVGREVWRGYFKFTVERNPWDAFASSYFYTVRGLERPPSFSEFFPCIEEYKRSFDIYRIKGRVAVDMVCRYEQLATDLEVVRQRLGLPDPLELPRAKSGLRGGRHYRELYSPAEALRVHELYADTVETFGYKF
jgi:hypothetical protein